MVSDIKILLRPPYRSTNTISRSLDVTSPEYKSVTVSVSRYRPARDEPRLSRKDSANTDDACVVRSYSTPTRSEPRLRTKASRKDPDSRATTLVSPPRDTLRWWHRNPLADSARRILLGHMSHSMRLAIEMSLHEADERRALEVNRPQVEVWIPPERRREPLAQSSNPSNPTDWSS